ncbi:hypothetical protein CFP71_07665 [Amycolatopsis thailandensis]|uniref:Uncharacterized protein n=1 Tax=Amycolatopsis thailandensis TaxID=589330 RepID=A0A229SFD4_9PSEU|nr:HAMP domain-containing histidine kinase [Amycolatopsis thailandensis]OXM57459.1 hypothetical protein CFP71_07665 [Amycolatopsis thailandensis]
MFITDQDDFKDVIRAWPEVWRQPKLFGLAIAPGPLSGLDAASAVLEGLETEVFDVADSFHWLLEAGDFRACRALLALPAAGMADERRSALDEQINRSIATIRTSLLPRSHRLVKRAETLGIRLDPEEWAKALTDSKQEALDLLDRIQFKLDKEAEQRAVAVESRFAGLPDERTRVAKACLANGEYAVAQRVVEQTDFQPWLSSPTTVRRPQTWPFQNTSNEEVLRWFAGEAPSPSDFEDYLPAKSDSKGRALVTALHDVATSLTADHVASLAAALDGFVQDAPINHHPRPAENGFQVDLCGLNDPRLPWLALPARVCLHVGQTPPSAGGKPRIWLPIGEDRPDLPESVVLLEPNVLFALVEPDGQDQAPTMQWRRINILRHLCMQLPFDQVADTSGTDLGEEGDILIALQWMFDMLGYQPAPEVPDMVLYYTAGIPDALTALVRELSRTVTSRPQLTHDHLTALRDNHESVRAIRDAVFAPLDVDLHAKVVFGALLARAATLGTSRISPNDLAAEVDRLNDIVCDEVERDEARRRELPPERVDMADAIDRIETAGLVTGGTQIVLAGEGLVALLANDDLIAWSVAELRRLHDVHDLLEENARLLLLNRTTRQNLHATKGYKYALEQLKYALNQAVDPDERRTLTQQVKHIEEIIDEYEAIQRGDVQQLLRTTTFDVAELVSDFAQSERHTGRLAIHVNNQVGTTAEVSAIRLLVRLALVDLALNAAQAMDAAKVTNRQMQLTVRQADRGDQCFAVIDVEDSGPGFGNVDNTALDQLRKQNDMPGGEGLRNVQRNLEACRGKLERVATRSSLGGAHLLIWLPLSS